MLIDETTTPSGERCAADLLAARADVRLIGQATVGRNLNLKSDFFSKYVFFCDVAWSCGKNHEFVVAWRYCFGIHCGCSYSQ